MSDDKKVLLSLKNVDVKFNVRGRILSAIRNVSLDIYNNEALAIVGESGSGKSVLTKTFAGMLDSNGFISNGTIIFSDDELSATSVVLTEANKKLLKEFEDKLNEYSVLERGAEEEKKIRSLKKEMDELQSLNETEEAEFSARMKKVEDTLTERDNFIHTLDKKNKEDAAEYTKTAEEIKALKAELKAISLEMKEYVKKKKAAYQNDSSLKANYENQIKELESIKSSKVSVADQEGNTNGLSDKALERNKELAAECVLSIGRFKTKDQIRMKKVILDGFKNAFATGVDLYTPENRNSIFDTVTFRVEYRGYDEEKNTLNGYAIVDCAKVKQTEDWQKIRGCKIATVFQDPMTSLNPVLTIGKQIMMVIEKHQKCSAEEAKAKTLDIMAKVGIPDPEKRFDDYPFQYSGGMRQRIVIAIALSCQPKILICDEPTTALDVTIQAQIIRLIKDLQAELGFTTVYITHDLGVVANVADRVAVLYGGQIVEFGTVEEIFYDPKHPYTWALLSSMPQLATRGSELYSITGTPPSLYNKIIGDSFAPRNPYALSIDFVKEPPMFKVTDTHYAKTWLLDPRAPKVEKPEIIQNLHEKMKATIVNLDD